MSPSAVTIAPDVEARLAELEAADVVVGIPSYNNARTIGHVVRAAAAGLNKYFPSERAVIVNSDGGSRDGTRELVAAAELLAPATILASHQLSTVHRIATPYSGMPGKGSALRTIFAIADRLGARATVVLDADLRSVRPEWIELLAAPVARHPFDFVAPLYHRHKFDGTITNALVYPLTRALYGKDVRQPIGGEFGLSRRLVRHLLDKPVWETSVARFGIDVWMTTTAIADGFEVCQAFLGAKLHDPKDPGADLQEMLVQVVSSVFDLMREYEAKWRAVVEPQPVPLFGFPHGVGLEPVSVNLERMLSIFDHGKADLAEMFERILAPETWSALRGVGAGNGAGFPDALWTRVVFDFAVAYERRLMAPDQLLGALVPLYLGRTASFIRETTAANAEEVEQVIARLAGEFLRSKPYLLARWDARPNGGA